MKYALKNSYGNKMVKKTLKHFTAIKMLKEMEENLNKNVKRNQKKSKGEKRRLKKLCFKFCYLHDLISFSETGEGCEYETLTSVH